jgi:malate/lactate dehydrogenase
MSDIITGVPVLLGRSGIMQTVNIPITSAEQEALEKAVQATRDTIAKLSL